jgi:hypothetical protein
MASMDAQAIYDNFHTHAQGTPGLAAAQQAAEQLSAKYQDRAVATQQLIDGVQTGWKGAAAEAAAQGLTPLAVNSLDTGGQLTTGHGVVGQQVDSFHTAVSEVQPVPPAPQMSNVIAAAVAGQDTTPMIDQITHSYSVQASNVVAYSKYVSASQNNTSSLPPITPVDAPTAPVAVTTPPPTPAASASTGGTHAPTVSGGSASRVNATRASGTGASGGGGASRPPAGGGSGTPLSGSGSSGSTSISSAAPPVVSPPSQSSPTGPGGGSGPEQNPPVGPVGPGGGTPGGGVVWPGGGGPASGLPGDGENGGTGPGGRSGVGAITEDAGGLGGLRSGSGSPGGRVAFGANSGAGGAGEQGPGSSRSGAGAAAAAGAAGAAEDEALAAERGAGPGGMSSAGAMGAGRGRGGEDSEHHRKFGVEEDGEELFGLDEAVMPPVVGENRVEREQRYAEEQSRHGEL